MSRLTVVDGDLFESKAQTLINTVNTVGVMGKGVALEFKKRFPEMYQDYVRRCERGEVKLGRPYLFKQLVQPWVLNFPTKGHWRAVSRLSDIEAGLHYLKRHYKEWGITSLAAPPLGCGNGGLEWRIVGPTLYRHFSTFDIPVEMYAPHGAPASELTGAFLAQPIAGGPAQPPSRVRPAWAAIVEIVRRVQQQPYHWPIGRVAIQKIAYFATEAGLPTGLTFERGSYGPFSPGLKPVLSRLVNNGLLEERSVGKMIAVQPGRTYRDAARAFQSDIAEWEPIIERVVDLFLRIHTRQAEVAATVHFAAHRLVATDTEPTELDVLDAVKEWKQRRNPPLREEEVARAIRSLNMLDWLRVQPSSSLPGVDSF
jgi:O-acetyl-ADP-ribose deacetylase (regulator of RNase III)/uncharacterized protein YwgA